MRAFCTGAEPLNSSPGFFPEDEKVANKGSERFKQVWKIIFFVFGIRLKEGRNQLQSWKAKKGGNDWSWQSPASHFEGEFLESATGFWRRACVAVVACENLTRNLLNTVGFCTSKGK